MSNIVVEMREVHIPCMDLRLPYIDGLSNFAADYIFYKMLSVENGLSDRELQTFVNDTSFLNVARHLGQEPDTATLHSIDRLIEDIEYFIPMSLYETMPIVLMTHPFLWRDHNLTYATYDRVRLRNHPDNEVTLELLENFWEEGEFYCPSAQFNRLVNL